MSSVKKVGFIGLGNMGFHMASNLLKAGYTVYGMDVNPQAEQRFAQLGGETGVAMEALAEGAEVILTSLPTPQVVDSVYFGENGLINHAHSGLTLIDLSTISPKLNDKAGDAARQKGAGYLGAPVSGGAGGAEKGTLTIMVGGDKQRFDAALPVLESIGKKIFHLGEKASAGTVVKLLNNLMAGFYTQAVAETVSLAEQMGVNTDTLYDVLSVSFAQSTLYEWMYKNFIAQNNFKAAFSGSLLLKDLKLAKEMAEEYHADLPVGSKLVEFYSDLVEKGYGDKDASAAYLLLKENIEGRKGLIQ